MAFTFPWLRKRTAVPPVVGGNAWFQTQSPQGSPLSADQLVGGTFQPGIAYYHEGDLFTPGTGNYVFENGFELPIQTIWGQAFLRTPNTFNPLQPRPIYAPQNILKNGIGDCKPVNLIWNL
jgi:hypothetical protein